MKTLTFLRRAGRDIAEKKPEIKDAQSEPQLAWRTMFNLCVDLWHTLSAAEKAVWESQGTARHMTGYAWYLSQCLRPNPGIYLPLAGGTMSGDIDMAKFRVLKLPSPSDSQEPVTFGGHIGARVYHSLEPTIPNTTWQSLVFNSQRYDTDNIHSTVALTDRLTCRTAGYYWIYAMISFNSNIVGIRILRLVLNGATMIGYLIQNATVAEPASFAVASLYYLSVNDYVVVQGYQNSGGALAILSRAQYSPEFMMSRLVS